MAWHRGLLLDASPALRPTCPCRELRPTALSRRPGSCGYFGGPVAQQDEDSQLQWLPVPTTIIQQAIWLYLRFTLSLRDVEDLLAERGITVSHEPVRRWISHFGPLIAAHLHKRRPKPHAELALG